MTAIENITPQGLAIFAIADAARRFDPTGTTDIRSRFRRDMDGRWTTLRRMIFNSINGDADLLGMGALSVQGVQAHIDPVRTFQSFVDGALSRIVLSGDGSWVEHYLDEAAARARSRAEKMITQRVTRDAVHHVVRSTAAVELQGIAELVSQRAVRAVSQAMIIGSPRRLLAKQAADVALVGKTRGRVLVNFTINQAFNNATLDIFEAVGLTKVGIQPERVMRPATDAVRASAGPGSRTRDPSARTISRIRQAARSLERLKVVEVMNADDPCPVCEDIAAEGPYTINQARGLIPAHPNCQCAFVPFFDSRAE